jgi:hypothetical protein
MDWSTGKNFWPLYPSGCGSSTLIITGTLMTVSHVPSSGWMNTGARYSTRGTPGSCLEGNRVVCHDRSTDKWFFLLRLGSLMAVLAWESSFRRPLYPPTCHYVFPSTPLNSTLLNCTIDQVSQVFLYFVSV